MQVTVKVKLANSEKLNKKMARAEKLFKGVSEESRKILYQNLLDAEIKKALKARNNEIDIIEMSE